MAAWAAIDSSRPASASPHASPRVEKIESVPNGPVSPASGAAMTERMPNSATYCVAADAVREARVGGVIARPDGPCLDHGLAGDALLQRLVGIDVPGLVVGLHLTRRVGPAEQPRLGIDEVDPGAVGAQQAGGLVDRELQHAREIRGGRDPGIDLPKRALDLGPLGELRAGPVEVLDQAHVAHRGGGVIGQRADEGDLGLVERVGAGGERAHGPEHPVARGEWRDDHRADADVLDDAVGLGGVTERGVVRVVARDHDGALGDRTTEHARRRAPAPDRGPTRGSARCGCRRRART